MRWIGFIVAIASLLAVLPAAADQNDDRLDPLFERLAAASNRAEAEAIEQAIWRVWLEPETAGVKILMRTGMQDMSSGKYESAERHFTAAIELEPEFAEAWNKRATVRYHMDDYAGSIEDISQTLALEERHFGALSGLGLIYDSINQKRAAIEAFRAALEINPHLAGIRDRMKILVKEVEGVEL